MYFNFFGGCTTLLSSAVKYSLVVMAIGLSAYVEKVNAQTPGSVLGTDQVMQGVQTNIVNEHPQLVSLLTQMQMDFSKSEVFPTEEQVRYVLSRTDSCTDRTVKDVLSDPDRRREVALIFYLDTYSKEGPKAAENVLVRLRGHPTTQKE